MNNNYSNIPGIYGYDSNFINPTIGSPNTYYEIPFAQTRESLSDVQTYEKFVTNAVSRFRRSRTYKNYKSYLYELGFNRCHFQGNITKDMATLEMHHNMLTIFDIAVIITEHVLNTVGYITSFDLVTLLGEEHTNNRVQLVMLTLTNHHLEHGTPDFFIHPDMTIGNWYEFLERYRYGITPDIANKIIFYLSRAIEEGGSNDHDLLTLREEIRSWSEYNYHN